MRHQATPFPSPPLPFDTPSPNAARPFDTPSPNAAPPYLSFRDLPLPLFMSPTPPLPSSPSPHEDQAQRCPSHPLLLRPPSISPPEDAPR